MENRTNILSSPGEGTVSWHEQNSGRLDGKWYVEGKLTTQS